MKFTSLPAALLCTALLLTACDKKTDSAAAVPPATPAPPPAPVTPPAEVFSDAGATDFLKEYKGYFNNLADAVKTGDTTKLQPLMAKGGELMAKGKEWAAKVKPEEFKAYTEKLNEYAKPLKEAAVKLSAGALDKIKALEASSRERLETLKNKLVTPVTPAAPTEPAPPAAPAPEPAAN